MLYRPPRRLLSVLMVFQGDGRLASNLLQWLLVAGPMDGPTGARGQAGAIGIRFVTRNRPRVCCAGAGSFHRAHAARVRTPVPARRSRWDARRRFPRIWSIPSNTQHAPGPIDGLRPKGRGWALAQGRTRRFGAMARRPCHGPTFPAPEPVSGAFFLPAGFGQAPRLPQQQARRAPPEPRAGRPECCRSGEFVSACHNVAADWGG